MDTVPLLSVCLITYNHEKYIRQALDGIFMQEINFPMEVIIADDCSTDNTRNIILKYKEKFGDVIKLIFQEKNVGPAKNWTDLMTSPNGKYVAYLEGDDYWTDSLKLQKQVDFLESHQNYVICFHKVKILEADGSIVDDFITKIPENYQERITLANNPNYIHSPSIVFKNIVRKEINLTEMNKSPIGDYFLYLLISQYGKIGYIDSIMAIYRHGVGVYSSVPTLKRHNQELLMFINLYSAEKDPDIKETFYNNILGYVKHLESQVEKHEKNNFILKTRRHVFIEKLYRLFK